MKSLDEIDIIWADNFAQGIREKIQRLEFMKSPYIYSVSVTRLFVDPKPIAIKKLKKFVRKWNYNLVFCKNYEYTKPLKTDFLKTYRIKAVLYRKLLQPIKIIDNTK